MLMLNSVGSARTERFHIVIASTIKRFKDSPTPSFKRQFFSSFFLITKPIHKEETEAYRVFVPLFGSVRAEKMCTPALLAIFDTFSREFSIRW